MHRSVTLVLFAFNFEVNGMEQVVQHIASAEDLVDKFVDRLVGRVLEASPVHCKDLETSMLAKDLGHPTLATTHRVVVGTKVVPSLTRIVSGASRTTRPRPLAHRNAALRADLGCLIGRTATSLTQRHVFPWSKRKRAAQLGITGAQLDSDVTSTLVALDFLLNDSSTNEAPDAGKLRKRSAMQNAMQRTGSDLRPAFRKLVRQSRHQLFIQTLLSANEMLDVDNIMNWIKGQPSMLPDLEWLAKPDSQQFSFDGIGTKVDSNNTGVKVHQEMTLPVLPMQYVIAPGELMMFKFFEPRWISLFAKLTGDELSSRLLRSASRRHDINLDAKDSTLSKALRFYELDEDDEDWEDELMDIVTDIPMYAPSLLNTGFGRLNESLFIGTQRFGICVKPFSFGLRTLTTVGTVMEILGTDVKVDEDGTPSFLVVARGVERFRATQLRQESPYYVVDAVPFVDVAEDSQEDAEREVRGKIMSELVNETDKLMPFTINLVETLVDEDFEGYLDTESEDQESLMTAIKKEARNLSLLNLAVKALRTRPKAAQALLACSSATQRLALVKSWLPDRKDGSWSMEKLDDSFWLILAILSAQYFVQNFVDAPQFGEPFY